MFWPCETRTSTCRNLATISSGLYRFLAISVLLDVRDIPQVGPLQWGWISQGGRSQLLFWFCRWWWWFLVAHISFEPAWGAERLLKVVLTNTLKEETQLLPCLLLS